MDREVLVHVELQGTPHLGGRLWARMRKDRESATFEYDKSWLAHPGDQWSLRRGILSLDREMAGSIDGDFIHGNLLRLEFSCWLVYINLRGHDFDLRS